MDFKELCYFQFINTFGHLVMAPEKNNVITVNLQHKKLLKKIKDKVKLNY